MLAADSVPLRAHCRQPTNEQRVRVGLSWLEVAAEEARKLAGGSPPR